MWKSRVAALAGVLVGLLFLSSFAPTILFPPKLDQAGSTVFVIDHGTHSSIAIETSENDMIRYAYGDLHYYARRDTSLASGAAALLWPTNATLGRGTLTSVQSEGDLLEQIPVVIEKVYLIEVSESAASALIAELEEIFSSGEDQLIAVAPYGLDFVPHPDSYFWANNSSTTIAGWLRDLGVGVLGWGLFASWRVAG